MQFIAGWTEFRLNNGLSLDIPTDIKGLEDYTFHECLQMASIADIDGVNIPFLHINHLIKNKQVIDRPKDGMDINALKKLQKLRVSE